VLRQVPGASSAAGIVLVVVAGIAATRTGGRERLSEDAAGIDPRLELVQADAGPRPPLAGPSARGRKPADQPS
jgi:hypothetical protein